LIKEIRFMSRLRYSSGTQWERLAGFSRAIRTGNSIQVSGTTATDENGNLVGADDPYEQTIYIIRKIERALNALGASLKDVTRTRIFIVDKNMWEPISRAHGEIFASIQPANTLIEVSGIIGAGYLVEIEADAIIGDA
jgi:enamine deaminase RidA (YjgF/YER057c/UK114 family)